MRPVPSTPVLVPRVAAVSGLAVLATMATAACGSDKGDVVGTDCFTSTCGGSTGTFTTPPTGTTGDTGEPRATGDTGAPPTTGETGASGGDTADTANPYGSGSGSYAGTWPASGSGAVVGTSPSGGSGR